MTVPQKNEATPSSRTKNSVEYPLEHHVIKLIK